MRTFNKPSIARRAGLALAAVIAAATLTVPVHSARADFDLPDAGSYALTICSGTMASGSCAGTGDVPINDDTEFADFTELQMDGVSDCSSFNDCTNSYVVCNNASSGYYFTVTVYKDINLKNAIQTDTLQLPPYTCTAVNITDQDTASSIEVVR